MLAVSLRTLRALASTGALVALSASAQAQYWDPCNVCAPPVTVMAAPCLQPVTAMEERQVRVTAYRDEERVVKRPFIRTVMEDREFTTYQTVNETRTAEVPSVAYQQQTEMRQVTQNRSFWRTNWQPVPKLNPCQVDPRPGFAGEMNRLGYTMRMAFAPNYIPRREFVPNVVAYDVPVTRTVAVPTTRTVTYNVAKVVPVTETRQVAVRRVEYEDTTVKVKVPYTETRTVSVPTTRYALVDPYGGGSVSAARPTPSRSAQSDQKVEQRSADSDHLEPTPSNGEFKPLSYPQRKAPKAEPRFREAQSRPTPAAETKDTSVTAARPVPSAVRVAGWRPSRHAQPAQAEGPVLSVAAK